MFEDSTFASEGRIHTDSHRWMLVTLLLNSAWVSLLIVIPLLHPGALPSISFSKLLLLAPEPIKPIPVQTIDVPQGSTSVSSSPVNTTILARPKLSLNTSGTSTSSDAATDFTGIEMGREDAVVGSGTKGLFATNRGMPIVRRDEKKSVVLSSGVVAGMLVYKSMPSYPQIAVVSRTEGTVVLAASISTRGVIENLHVVSGPEMLRQAALNAVRDWRYRPYVLNGEPVAVETTINVIFSLNR